MRKITPWDPTVGLCLGPYAGPRGVALPPTPRLRKEGTTSNVSRAVTHKLRPESGRDCLMCAIFAQLALQAAQPLNVSSATLPLT